VIRLRSDLSKERLDEQQGVQLCLRLKGKTCQQGLTKLAFKLVKSRSDQALDSVRRRGLNALGATTLQHRRFQPLHLAVLRQDMLA